MGYREAASVTRCEVQRERALELDERLPTGAFAAIPATAAAALWRLRERCEALNPDDAASFVETWHTYEQAVRAQFGEDVCCEDPDREVLDTLIRERRGARSFGPTILPSGEARKLMRLAEGIGTDVRVQFVAASLVTARSTGPQGTVGLVAVRRRSHFHVSVATAAQRRAPLLVVRPAGMLEATGDGGDDLDRAFVYPGTTDPHHYLRGGARGALRALLELATAPRVVVRDGLAAVHWTHRSAEPLPIALRLVAWLVERAGRRDPRRQPSPDRRYRRWPPPAKR